MIELDCSVLEGGGQIIRNCLAYSAVLQKPVHLFNIRSNRPKPGLSKQHLLVAQVIKDLTCGSLEGAALQSVDLQFTPSSTCTDATSLCYDVGSAGSISLILQAALPCLFFLPLTRPFSFSLMGGTDVPFSPPIDHLQHVLLPCLAGMGMGLTADLLTPRRGFYPAGGGRVDLIVAPVAPGTVGTVAPAGAVGAVGASRTAGVAEAAEAVVSTGAVGVVGMQGLDLTCPGRVVGVAGRIHGTGAHFTHLLADRFEEMLCESLGQFFRTRNLVEAEADLEDLVSAQGLFGGGGRSGGGDGGDEGGGGGRSGRGGRGGRGGGGGKGGQHSTLSVQVWLITTGVPISANVLYEGKRADFFNPTLGVQRIVDQLAWVVDNGACVDEHTADHLIIYLALGALTTSTSASASASASVTPLPFRVLCAPRVGVNPGTHGMQSSSTMHSASTMNASTLVRPSTLEHSSLHIEAAAHVASLLSGVRVTVTEQEDVGGNRNRLISAVAVADSGSSS
jgi:RNA 3'-terminal phosphate cyclase